MRTQEIDLNGITMYTPGKLTWIPKNDEPLEKVPPALKMAIFDIYVEFLGGTSFYLILSDAIELFQFHVVKNDDSHQRWNTPNLWENMYDIYDST